MLASCHTAACHYASVVTNSFQTPRKQRNKRHQCCFRIRCKCCWASVSRQRHTEVMPEKRVCTSKKALTVRSDASVVPVMGRLNLLPSSSRNTTLAVKLVGRVPVKVTVTGSFSLAMPIKLPSGKSKERGRCCSSGGGRICACTHLRMIDHVCYGSTSITCKNVYKIRNTVKCVAYNTKSSSVMQNGHTFRQPLVQKMKHAFSYCTLEATSLPLPRLQWRICYYVRGCPTMSRYTSCNM